MVGVWGVNDDVTYEIMATCQLLCEERSSSERFSLLWALQTSQS